MIASAQTANGSIADVNEKRFVSHGGEPQYAHRGFLKFDSVQIQFLLWQRLARDIALHFWRITQQHLHRHIDSAIIKFTVINDQIAIFGQRTDNRGGAALALAQCFEFIDPVVANQQHIAFLRLVAPDTHRRHARLSVGYISEFYVGTVLAVIDGFGYRIR